MQELTMQNVPEEKRIKHKCYLLLLVTLTNKENNKTTGLTQNEQSKKLLRDRL